MKNKASIVIPVKNGAPFVNRALDSVFEQLPEGWDVIVVDDASVDGTPDLVSAFDEVSLIRASRAGVTSARIDGAKFSKARFLFFMDVDDTLPVGALAALNDAIDTSDDDCDVIFGDFYEGEEDSMWLSRYGNAAINKGKELFDWIIDNRRGFLWAKLINRDLYLSIPLIPYDVKFCEDYLQMLQITYFARRVKYIPTPLYRYIQHPASLCNQRKSRSEYADMFYRLCKSLRVLVYMNKFDSAAILRLKVMYLYYMRLYLWVAGGWRGVNVDFKNDFDNWAKDKSMMADSCYTPSRRRQTLITSALPWAPALFYVPLLRHISHRIK